MAAAGAVAVKVIRYAAPYNPMSSSDRNSVEILGVATEIMVLSRDMRVMPSIREVIIIKSLISVGYSISVCSMVAAGIEGPALLSAKPVLIVLVISSFAMKVVNARV